MPVTAAKSIQFPDSTYPVSPLENLFSALATSVDTAITSLQQISLTSVTNQAARDALFPAPVANNQVFRQDTGQIDRYNGTAWQQINEVLTGAGVAASLSAAGTLGITSGITIPAVPWARKLSINLRGTTTSFSATYADMIIRKDGSGVANGRITTVATGNATYTEILAANATTTYQGVVTTVGGGANVTATNSLTFMTIETVSM